jgi:DNA-binding response OmpR family regulator
LSAIRVLWIDDDAGFVRPLAAFLSRCGCEVARLTAGRTALAALGGASFDVVVIEWHLSDVSGRDLLAAFVNTPPSTPVLVLSRYIDLESAREAGRLGACRVRRKPIGCVDLLAEIRNCATPDALPAPSEWSWTARARDLLLDAAAGLATSPAQTGDVAVDILKRLARLLTEPGASIPEIASGTRAFRHLRSSPECKLDIAIDACRIIDAAVFDFSSLEPVILDVVAEFQRCGGETRLSEEATARRLGVSSSHLGRLLRRQTRLDWRGWSVAARLRVVLRDLGSSAAPLKMIAFDRGWHSYEQFCRDVHDQLSISPGEFRKVIRSRDQDAQVGVSTLQAGII